MVNVTKVRQPENQGDIGGLFSQLVYRGLSVSSKCFYEEVRERLSQQENATAWLYKGCGLVARIVTGIRRIAMSFKKIDCS